MTDHTDNRALAGRIETHERNLNNGFPITSEICGDMQEAAAALTAAQAKIEALEAERDEKLSNRRAYQVGVAVGRASRQAEIDTLLAEARADALREALQLVKAFASKANAAPEYQTLAPVQAATAMRLADKISSLIDAPAPAPDDKGICPHCMGSGESVADQTCPTCDGSGADAPAPDQPSVQEARLPRPNYSSTWRLDPEFVMRVTHDINRDGWEVTMEAVEMAMLAAERALASENQT